MRSNFASLIARVSVFTMTAASAIALVGCNADSTPADLGGRLNIDSPAGGSVVTASADKKLTIDFTTNFLLKNPGTCGGQNGCGSVFLLVDGTACNAPGAAYNTLATSSPATVDLSLCSMVIGQHAISAELHQDDGSIEVNPVSRSPITSSVTVTVTQ